jgi:hypothetical protein
MEYKLKLNGIKLSRTSAEGAKEYSQGWSEA